MQSKQAATPKDVPILQSIAVTPVNPTMLRGDTLQLTATGTFSDQSTVDITSDVFWSDDPSGIVTVNQGLVTAIYFGQVQVMAYVRDISDSTVINVQPSSYAGVNPIPMGVWFDPPGVPWHSPGSGMSEVVVKASPSSLIWWKRKEEEGT